MYSFDITHNCMQEIIYFCIYCKLLLTSRIKGCTTSIKHVKCEKDIFFLQINILKVIITAFKQLERKLI